jgi:multidrug efflux pump subunit AcrA (membrane-fusion protein)
MKRTNLHIFLAILILGGVGTGCGNSPRVNADDPANAPSAAVVKVTRHDLASNLEIASEFQPYQEIQVYAKVSGYIQKLYVDWGSHVKQGQLLAVLEIPELQQQLQQDEAGLRRSQQAYEGAREELKRSESVGSARD